MVLLLGAGGMKRFVEGEDRRQGALLPHCLDDYVTENNPVRVVEAFIDELDLATLGFDGVVPETTGRPAYTVAKGSSSVTSSTLSTAGIRRGCGTTVSRRDKSGRSSVTVKKKRSAETELLMLGACMPIRVWCSWNRRRSSAVAVSGERLMKAANDRTCRT